MNREEDLKKIIDHYGLEHQVLKLAEEAVELADACFKHLKGGYAFTVENILEELADVHIVGSQLRIVFQGDDYRDVSCFDTLVDRKIDRTLGRMNEAEVGRAE